MDGGKVLQLFLLLYKVKLHPVCGVKHSLQFCYTGVTPLTNFPEFTAVGLVDGEPFDYYDSNIKKMIPKTEWIKKVANDDPDYWDRQTENQQLNQERFKSNVADLIKFFNQTEGFHTLQKMYGCEWDDDGTRRGYSQLGYEGEDFLILDLNTETWTAANHKAVYFKQKWEAKDDPRFLKVKLENKCIEQLEKYVDYGRSALERKVPPKTELFQKDSSSPLVCLATGFFPKNITMYWLKDGEEVHEDVELRETVPNPDGTFQKRSILTVSPEELKKNKYSCVIEHSGVKKEIPLSDIRVLNGIGLADIITDAGVAVLLLVLIVVVGYCLWMTCDNSGYRKADVRPGRPPPPPPVDSGVPQVSTVLDSRDINGSLEYLVKWEGRGPDEELCWLPAEEVLDLALKADFHHKHPNKPGPPPKKTFLCGLLQ